jgi:hypothetical protein
MNEKIENLIKSGGKREGDTMYWFRLIRHLSDIYRTFSLYSKNGATIYYNNILNLISLIVGNILNICQKSSW